MGIRTVFAGKRRKNMKILQNMNFTIIIFFLIMTFFAIVFIPQSCGRSKRIISIRTESGDRLGSGRYERSIMHRGMKRLYIVYVPSQYKKDNPMSVVLNFHGGMGNAEQQERDTLMNSKAEEAGFIVVYPYGTGKFERKMLRWNAGQPIGWPVEHNIDDVGFVKALLDDLEKTFKIDSKRIYATGWSNGGMMCYRLACELSDRIAAIAAVSSAIPPQLPCKPSRPVPVIQFHGTNDEFIPINGGVAKRTPEGEIFKSFAEGTETWVKLNGCKGDPELTLQKGKVTCKTYKSCNYNSEVVQCIIEGGGHTWPGGRPVLPAIFGQTTTDISANDLMWDFFQKHPMR